MSEVLSLVSGNIYTAALWRAANNVARYERLISFPRVDNIIDINRSANVANVLPPRISDRHCDLIKVNIFFSCPTV